MRKIKIVVKNTICLLACTFIVSGCSSKRVKTTLDYKNSIESINAKKQSTNKYMFETVTSTTQKDTKELIDMGRYAKIWIKGYKYGNNSYTPDSYVVTMLRAPGFIKGEYIPGTEIDKYKRTKKFNTDFLNVVKLEPTIKKENVNLVKQKEYIEKKDYKYSKIQQAYNKGK